MSIRVFRNLALIGILISLLLGCDKVTEPEHVEDTVTEPEYSQVWAEEFNQESETINTDVWNYDLGYSANGWGNDEWQLYTDSLENVKVKDGMLVITALLKGDQVGKRDGSITSARINTKDKFSIKFGKVEARIKVPAGTGMWPAFWMLGQNIDDVSWPYCGEIDIMEVSPFYHNNKTTMCTVHWYDDVAESHQYYGTTKELNVPLTDDFHIYTVEWDEEKIVGKIDGMTYFTKIIDPATMSEFLQNYFLVLNVAVGGNLGGVPDLTTEWPQSMYVDWIRAYENTNVESVDTFGVFTDTTPVDDGIIAGTDADIYVWDGTLGDGAYAPYEGNNVLTWFTKGSGWFGAGIKSKLPLDLSGFEGGNLNFMIKMPADVTFKIGMTDTDGNENFVTFTAEGTNYNLVRNGEWGRAIIPLAELKGNIDLENTDYVFVIKEEEGADCHFAIDDIYLDGGNTPLSRVSFEENSYTLDTDSVTINLVDEGAVGSTVSAIVKNGLDSIYVDFVLDSKGVGSSAIKFGTTNDATNTIAVAEGDTLKVSYLDANGLKRADSALIYAELVENGTFAVFTDDPTINEGLTIEENAQIFVWEQTLVEGSIPAYEGENVLSWQDNGKGWFGAGIATNSPVDLSEYANGNLNLMIKIPADVTFRIGIIDQPGTENYVHFPANQTAYNLTRDGEWGQVVIPMSELKGSLDLSQLNYLFAIVAEGITNCEFAIDHIYYDGKGAVNSSVSFDSESYTDDTSTATISVSDDGATSSTVSVSVTNGTDTISINIALDASGNGTGTVNFGTTNDETDTILITDGDTLTATYTDSGNQIKNDTAAITSGSSSDEPTEPAETPNHDSQNVISLFSDNYTNVTVDTWSAEWDSADLTDITISGDNVKFYENLVFAGIEFTSETIDASEMTYLHFDIWTPEDLTGKTFKFKLVDFGADGAYDGGDDTEHEITLTESDLTSKNWNGVDIPLSSFTGLGNTEHLAQIVIAGEISTIYLDNLFFYKEGQTSETTMAIFSETHNDETLIYNTIVNSADWSGNSAAPDAESTAVTPLEGTYVLSVEFTDLGSGWGGIAFDFGSQDVSSYTNLIFSVNKSEMTSVTRLGIKFEDSSTGNTEVNISNYSGVTSGDWITYKIPVSDFPGCDFTKLKYLGIWNPANDSEVMQFGNLHLDDIYLSK